MPHTVAQDMLRYSCFPTGNFIWLKELNNFFCRVFSKWRIFLVPEKNPNVLIPDDLKVFSKWLGPSSKPVFIPLS